MAAEDGRNKDASRGRRKKRRTHPQRVLLAVGHIRRRRRRRVFRAERLALRERQRGHGRPRRQARDEGVLRAALLRRRSSRAGGGTRGACFAQGRELLRGNKGARARKARVRLVLSGLLFSQSHGPRGEMRRRNDRHSRRNHQPARLVRRRRRARVVPRSGGGGRGALRPPALPRRRPRRPPPGARHVARGVRSRELLPAPPRREILLKAEQTSASVATHAYLRSKEISWWRREEYNHKSAYARLEEALGLLGVGAASHELLNSAP